MRKRSGLGGPALEVYVMESMQTSRREFLQNAATVAAAHFLARPARLSAAVPRSPVLQEFDYSEVKLTGGPLRAQFDRVHASYLALNEDSVLKGYRERAGLPAPGPDMGGWYDPDGFAPGCHFGQYVSALARFARATGDPATRAKVQRLVDGFAATLDSDNFPYMNTKAATMWPSYTYDKHIIGLLDAHRFADISSALPTLRRVTTGAQRYLPPKAWERIDAPRQTPWDESYTLPENLFYAYEITGRQEYLAMAQKYLDNERLFDPLAEGKNVLPGLHAYSHCNALSSAARAYLVLNEERYLRTAQNAWDMIEQTQQFASGGWGPDEAFVEPHQGKLYESLTHTHSSFETPCGSYAHFKLARYLLRLTRESRYGDGLERVLYNAILGVKDLAPDGHCFYYSDYHPWAKKTYHPDRWPCCSGTLPQVVADYLRSAYFHDADGIYVNLFAPSEVTWKRQEGAVKLIQNTRFPEAEESELRLELARPADFNLSLRIPRWVDSSAELRVNGKSIDLDSRPGRFATIHRRWQAGDAVQIKLPFRIRCEPVDDKHPETVALMHGPLMLVALEPTLEIPRRALEGERKWKAVPGTVQTFESSLSRPVRFIPWYRVRDEAYTTYFTVKVATRR
jgi:uncharacterized protein